MFLYKILFKKEFVFVLHHLHPSQNSKSPVFNREFKYRDFIKQVLE